MNPTLTVDGFMRPDGPTENRINQHLAMADDGGGDDPGGDDPEDPWGNLPPSMCACESSDDNPYRQNF